jgi:hypothetical protein
MWFTSIDPAGRPMRRLTNWSDLLLAVCVQRMSDAALVRSAAAIAAVDYPCAQPRGFPVSGQVKSQFSRLP